ncbi:MAG: hypothetical protein P4L72_04870 [Parvibaculum sp.]|nr:hypothetical protein [Parvibaculum sp.]MDR3498543.1 hypothetical protein [Parvibaculum sp.]
MRIIQIAAIAVTLLTGCAGGGAQVQGNGHGAHGGIFGTLVRF